MLSPDGSTLAALGSASIWLLRVADGATIARLEDHRAQILSMAFSPDGTRIASASGVPSEFPSTVGDRTARVYTVSDGTQQAVFRVPGKWIAALAWSPDGTTLATGSLDHQVHFFRLR